MSELVAPNVIRAMLGGMSHEAFWRLVYDKKIPHYRFNARVIKFRQKEVEEWLERQKVQ